MPTIRHVAGCALVLSALIACGDPAATGPDSEGTAAIRVSANVSNTSISTIVVTIVASDLPISPVFNLTVSAGVASGTLRIPPGLARTFTVTAFDALGVITHDGQATRDVARGQNPPLAIGLTPRAGQVPITVSFGDYSVSIDPPGQILDIGANLQMTASVTDAGGQSIANPAVEWATTNPAIATVDATGMVTTLIEGEVDIVATYNGIAGISHLTVIFGGVVVPWYADADADGFGDPATQVLIPVGMPEPAGYVMDSSDCNDTDAQTYPGAPETALDGVDSDCDGQD